MTLKEKSNTTNFGINKRYHNKEEHIIIGMFIGAIRMDSGGAIY